MSPLSLRRYRADRLLRRDFDGLRSGVLRSVRRRLAARGVGAERIDLDACYAQAWQGLYATVLAGEAVENPAGWLVVVTYRRAIDDARGEASGSREPLVEADARAAEPDLAAALDDRARLRQVFEAVRGRMNGRECDLASLCYLQGLSRADAARALGLSERRVRKLMDGTAGRPGVAGKMSELLAVVAAGSWCEEQASLMRGLAFGLLDPEGERHRLAVAHQRACPACRAYVASLRGLAAALPPVGVPLALGAGTAATAGTVATVGAAGAAVGSGGAGGGWLLAGGSLGIKLAAGCLLALGVGAGCVALTVPGRAGAAKSHTRQHAQVRAWSPPARSRPAVAAGVAATGSPPASRARAASAATGRSAAALAPARREFSVEGGSSAAGVPATARLARAQPPAGIAPARTVRVSSPEPRARREFGVG